jgi:hypothetical protein
MRALEPRDRLGGDNLMTSHPTQAPAPEAEETGGRDWTTIAAAVGAAVNAGVFLCFSVFIMPAVRDLPAPQGIEAMQAFNRTAVVPFTLVGLGTAVVCVVVTVRAFRARGRARSTHSTPPAPTQVLDGPTSTPGGSGRTTCEQSAPSQQPSYSRPPGRDRDGSDRALQTDPNAPDRDAGPRGTSADACAQVCGSGSSHPSRSSGRTIDVVGASEPGGPSGHVGFGRGRYRDRTTASSSREAGHLPT